MDKFWKLFILGSIFFVLVCVSAVYSLYPQSGGYVPSGVDFESMNITSSSWTIHFIDKNEEKVLFNDLDEAVDYSQEYSKNLVESFNSRYEKDLKPIPVYLTNKSYNYFSVYEKSIYLAKDNPSLLEKGYVEYVTEHETCHYFQLNGCDFGNSSEIWESICEIYANRSHTEDECIEEGWSLRYCSPFRLNEINRQGFLDCVFGEACTDGATNERLTACYTKNRKDLVIIIS